MVRRANWPPLTIGEILRMAAATLWTRKLRTGLTMLGVVIGIASVIAVTAVGQGVQKAAEQRIQALGTNVIIVLAGAATTGGGISQGTGSASTLTWEDAQAIAAQVPAAKMVAAYLQKPQIQVVYGEQNTSTTLLGTDLNYPKIKNIHPQDGQFLSQSDLDANTPVAVLGAKVKEALFEPGETVIGTAIRIQGKRFIVIGVMESKGSAGGQDLDDQIYMPLTTMSAEIVGNNAIAGIAINGFWLEAQSAAQVDAAQFQVTNLLRIRHDIYPPQADDFRVINQVDIINTFRSIVGLFTVLIGAIAGISLLVGGIGIANIMLVSVVERTREIGIRKAVGATNRAILSQFLAEAVLISLIGGVIGLSGGIAIAYGAATVFQFPFVIALWAIFMAFGLSFVVGLLAGGIPANYAARLDPIAALRSD